MYLLSLISMMIVTRQVKKALRKYFFSKTFLLFTKKWKIFTFQIMILSEENEEKICSVDDVI